MDALLTRFLNSRCMEYLILDSVGQIVSGSSHVQRFAEVEHSFILGEDCRLGLPELVGFDDIFASILAGEDEHFELRAIARLSEDGTATYFDLWILRLDSSQNLDGAFILLFEDVSERMLLEQQLVQASNESNLLLSALSSSKEYIDRIISSMADALIVTTKTGIIKTVNQAAQILFEYSQEELVDQPISLLVADSNFFLPSLQPSGQNLCHDSEDFEVICQTKRGSKLSVSFSCAVIQSDQELSQDYIYIGRDITLQKRTQERLMAQYTTARILSEAETLRQAISMLLPALCQALGWDLIELWMPRETGGLDIPEVQPNRDSSLLPRAGRLPNPNSDRLERPRSPASETMRQPPFPPDLSILIPELHCQEIWSRSPTALKEFVLSAEQMERTAKVGLPGRVWATSASVWVPDVVVEGDSFLRSAIAQKVNLHTEFGFPVKNGREILGVLILMSHEIRPLDRDLLQTAAVIGNQFGQFIQRKRAEANLRESQEQTEHLLLNILPQPIAERLKQHPGTIAEYFPETTVLFADLANFTEMCTNFSPIQLVNLLNNIFSGFDRLTEQFGLEKIKTIGDAYMVVAGVPNHRADHAEAIANMALAMQADLQRFNHLQNTDLTMRIGIHSGPVVAGVIGIKKFIYDLWGDTVNTASRMESQGVPGRIQVTLDTYQRLQESYIFQERGWIPVKGKGEMMTYFLVSPQ